MAVRVGDHRPHIEMPSGDSLMGAHRAKGKGPQEVHMMGKWGVKQLGKPEGVKHFEPGAFSSSKDVGQTKNEQAMKPMDARKPEIPKDVEAKKTLFNNCKSAIQAKVRNVKGRVEQVKINQSLAKQGIKQNETIKVGDVKDSNLLGKPEVLGSGQVNQVLKLTLRDSGTGDKRSVAFKPEETFTPENQPVIMKGLGISAQKPMTLQRNIATYLLAQRLFPGIIPKTEAGVINGQVGTAMALAKGMPAGGDKINKPVSDLDPQDPKNMQILKAVDRVKEFRANGDLQSAELAKEMLDSLGVVEKDSNFYVRESTYPKINLDDPALKRLMTQIQLLDGATKQGDRHLDNIYLNLDAKGNTSSLEGIDNDQAYGEVYIPQKDYASDSATHAVDYPVEVHPDDIKAVLNLDIKGVEKDMKDLGFSQKEIDNHKRALGDLQTHLKEVDKKNRGEDTKLPPESRNNSYYMKFKDKVEETLKT